MSDRNITVYGYQGKDTEFKIWVDRQPIESCGYHKGMGTLFKFNTSTRLHGGCDVVIDVDKGYVVLTHCDITYPAEFNGSMQGTITFPQPIPEPLFIIKDKKISTRPFPLRIGAGKKFEYKHLMFNGPTKFLIQLQNHDLMEGNLNLYSGDLFENPCVLNFVYQVYYDYSHLPNDVKSPQDIEKLLSTLEKGGDYASSVFG